MGAQVEYVDKYPYLIHVDNSGGISFQHSTNPDTKLKGIFYFRHKWVQELRDVSVMDAIKIDTKDNISDMFTKCQSRPVFEHHKSLIVEAAAAVATRF